MVEETAAPRLIHGQDDEQASTTSPVPYSHLPYHSSTVGEMAASPPFGQEMEQAPTSSPAFYGPLSYSGMTEHTAAVLYSGMIGNMAAAPPLRPGTDQASTTSPASYGKLSYSRIVEEMEATPFLGREDGQTPTTSPAIYSSYSPLVGGTGIASPVPRSDAASRGIRRMEDNLASPSSNLYGGGRDSQGVEGMPRSPLIGFGLHVDPETAGHPPPARVTLKSTWPSQLVGSSRDGERSKSHGSEPQT